MHSLLEPSALALASAALSFVLASLAGEDPRGYRRAPQEIRDILDAPQPPAVSVSPTRDHMLLVDSLRYPPLADLAQPMLRLAGLRINPNTNGPHRAPRQVGLTLKALPHGPEQKISVPADPYLSFPVWSPDGRRFAFTHTTGKKIELWVGEVAMGTAKRLAGVILNAAYGRALQWMPDSRTLLCQTIPPRRGQPPAAPTVPEGPIIQESYGKTSPIRTFQDLLQNPYDETLFDYYATAQLTLVDSRTGKKHSLGEPGIFAFVDLAPDGEHLLVVRHQPPYSYLLPAFAFPKEVEIWDTQGRRIHTVASLPLEDQVPIEGVPTGPRGFHWRPTEPATLLWIEALDGGDPKRKVPHRDRVMIQPAPFQVAPVELAKTGERFAGLTWGEKAGLALLRDYDQDRRWVRTYLLHADDPERPQHLLWDRSVHDRYNDPGAPLLRPLPNGKAVLWQHAEAIFLAGPGGSPEGDRPFLDRFDLSTLQAERLFQCAEKTYEEIVSLLKDDGAQFLTRYETPSDPPNYYLRTARQSGKTALTAFPDPTPQLRAIRKQLVTYARPDGVALSFTLYLPPGHKPGQRLPAVVWAYPQEFSDSAVAGQVYGSPYRFTTLGGISHLFFLTQGYAVLDGATMPVVGDRETQNNTYIEQVVASAQAAIDKASEMGVADPARVGVGGHSYGAFMTANLLAHSDLFCAGIARSGAYNRTLTPFGFQAERRTLWEAPEMYFKISPFMHADKIKAPLLLIHGADDDNSGTFPVQSERFYQAIQGHGGHVRLVLLPFESHGYIARESVEHTLWEMITWFDKYVKGKSAR